MTPGGRLQVGDLVAFGDGERAIVLNVGRSACYSVQVFRQDERVTLYTEVPFHMERGALRYVDRRDVNVGWAKAWRYSNPDQLLDL